MPPSRASGIEGKKHVRWTMLFERPTKASHAGANGSSGFFVAILGRIASVNASYDIQPIDEQQEEVRTSMRRRTRAVRKRY